MGALPQEKRYFTYADYKEQELAEGERFELMRFIRQSVYKMRGFWNTGLQTPTIKALRFTGFRKPQF